LGEWYDVSGGLVCPWILVGLLLISMLDRVAVCCLTERAVAKLHTRTLASRRLSRC